MAIKVTVGEQKPQNELPFPKLIHCADTDAIVEVFEHPEKKGKYIGIHRTGKYEGYIALGFELDKYCVDYNGPITIQNA